MNAPDISFPNRAPTGCGPKLQNDLLPQKTQRQQVFERIRAEGTIPRIDVAKALGISPGTVTSIVSELMEEGLVRETDAPAPASGRGRPPVALSIEPRARFVAGVKLSDHAHTAVVTDFAGTVLGEATLATTPKRRPVAEAVAETRQLVNLALHNANLVMGQISALALGVPGIVDHLTGHVPWSPLIAGDNPDLRTALNAAFPFPVHIDNDANLVTMAELWFGAGRSRSDFAVVTIENGLGMGLVHQNRLFRGAGGQGLELGHTQVQIDGALCRCGRRGCLEAYVADYALAREASTAIQTDPTLSSQGAPELEALYLAAKAGHVHAQTIFRRAGRYLAAGLANVVQLFDPGVILISGARMRYDYLYAEEVLAAAKATIAQAGRGAVDIEIHRWGDLVWAQGAAALALQALTDDLLGKPKVST